MARIIDAFTQFFDDDGDPLIDGFLQFLESGTNNTDKDTFADISETIANTNPVQLDGAGRCPNIFGSGSYNVISYAEDPNNPGNPGQQIQQFDPVSGDAFQGALSDWNSATIYGEGDLVTGSDGNYYRSLISNNQNQDPTSSPGQWEEVRFIEVWNTNVVYSSGDLVSGSDGLLYISRIDTNSGNDPISDNDNWRLLNDGPNLLNNISFTAAVDTKALTFALKTNDLSDPTGFDKVIVAFRNSTLTSAKSEVVSAIAAASIVAPDGATLGFSAAETNFIYLYALNNAGTLELAIAGKVLDETILHTTVAIDATADSGSVLYSTTLRANVAIRLLGRIKIATGAVAGEWDNDPTELYTGKIFEEQKLTSGTAIATTSGTSHDITGIPEWVKRVTFIFNDISTDGISDIIVQLGDSGGIETTGYTGYVVRQATSSNVYQALTGGFVLTETTTAAHVMTGHLVFTLIDGTTWVATGIGTDVDSALDMNIISGNKTLTSALTQLRLTTGGGTDNFDNGSINILYE